MAITGIAREPLVELLKSMRHRQCSALHDADTTALLGDEVASDKHKDDASMYEYFANELRAALKRTKFE